jgi:3-methyladenine DNA glycosylase/8-oxoguanine DNA glycosylase
LIGCRDDLTGFDPGRGIVRELHRRMPGLRITRSGEVLEALVPSILEQKIAGKLARASYRHLVLALGERAPGPAGLRLPPSAERLAAMRYQDFHRFGIEMRRANVIRHAAASPWVIRRALQASPAEAHRILRSLPGIGAWTAAEVAIVALGDADAVSVGDYHLPHQVAWVLTCEPRADDARMLELLAPFAGHRGRVLRLIGASGIQAPRFGPRQPLFSPARL